MRTAERRDYVSHGRPDGLCLAEGCRLIGLPRSTFYDVPVSEISDQAIVDVIRAVCDDFEIYGYRRVGAAFCHRGLVVKGKKVRRLTVGDGDR